MRWRVRAVRSVPPPGADGATISTAFSGCHTGFAATAPQHHHVVESTAINHSDDALRFLRPQAYAVIAPPSNGSDWHPGLVTFMTVEETSCRCEASCLQCS